MVPSEHHRGDRGDPRESPVAKQGRSLGLPLHGPVPVRIGRWCRSRIWQLAAKPDWQYDEGVYTRVATNLLQHGTLSEHITVNTPWQPFLYQPPFYFTVLARWFALTGPSIYHARIFGVLCSVVTLAMLHRIVLRVHGPRVALFVMLPVIFDGWLLYIQRCSYIENPLLMLVTAGILLYQWALDKPSWQRFAAAGGMLGFAAVFKHTGVYSIGAVALCWLILRREHRKHLILLISFAVVVVTYVAWMVHTFDVPGHDWYVHQTMVQIRRVLGLQHSGGTVTSPVKFLHLLLRSTGYSRQVCFSPRPGSVSVCGALCSATGRGAGIRLGETLCSSHG